MFFRFVFAALNETVFLRDILLNIKLMFCIVLYFKVLYCIVLYCIVLFVLYCIVRIVHKCYVYVENPSSSA